MRPCKCDNCDAKRPWKEQAKGACKHCFLYHANPKFKAAWDGTAERIAPPLDPPCVHRSKEPTGEKSEARCGGKHPELYRCEQGRGVNGLVALNVCDKNKKLYCGPACEGYATGPTSPRSFPKPTTEPKTLEDYQSHLDYRSTLDYPPGKFEGDGIVIVGAGRYWLSACLSARMARDMGWKSGIQIWHREKERVTHPEWIKDYGVEVVNANEYATLNLIPLRNPFDDVPTTYDSNGVTKTRNNHGAWVLKSFAVKHAPFRRVLFLDADAYPVANPHHLFDYFNSALGIWWDMKANRNGVKWEIHPHAKPYDGMGGVNGGQFLIDKANADAWRFLNVWDWTQQHADHYYQWMFGDQDAFRLAAAVCRTPFQKMGESYFPMLPVNLSFMNDEKNRRAIIHRFAPKIGLASDGMGGKDFVPWHNEEARLWAHADEMRLSAGEPSPTE